LIELFDRYDGHKKDFLSYTEAKEFFSTLLNLNLRRKKHFMALARLLDEMEVTDYDCLEKEVVVNFFIYKDGYARFQTILREESGNLLKDAFEVQRTLSFYDDSRHLSLT